MENGSNISNPENAKELNENISNALIPINVILTLYLFLGVAGNCVVLYVYKFHFTGKLKERYFTPVLALTDLLACIVCGSFGLLDNSLYLNFNNTYLCKTMYFLVFLSTSMSVMLLLIIAVQRYRKIVKPLGRQMDTKQNRVALLSAFFFSFIFAFPTPFIYGTKPETKNNGTLILGMRCTADTEENPVLSMVYSSLVGIITLIIIGSLIGIYLHIAWAIYKHMKFQRKFVNAEGSSDIQTTEVERESDIDGKNLSYKNCNDEKCDQQTKNAKEPGLPNQDAVERRTNSTYSRKSMQDERERTNKKIMYKFTLMFMLITVIFLICYIPTTTVIFLYALNAIKWDELSISERAAGRFVNTLYIINNVANPFVYAFLDTKFRNALKQMCCKRGN